MTADRLQIRSGDGRRLDVELAGPPDGPAVLFQPGTPSSGSVFAPMVELGAKRGLRHIAMRWPAPH